MSNVPGERDRDLEVEALQARIAVVCGQLNALHAELAGLVAEALDGDLWSQWGIRSPEHWLAWQAGLSAGRARQLVTIARRAVELPVTTEAFAAGELAVDQMAVVARHAPAHNDSQACELAKVATVTQLSHALSRYVRAEPEPAPEPDPSSGCDPRDHLNASFDDHGRYRLSLECSTIDGEAIDKAIAEARDALFHDGHPHVTDLAAIGEIARRSLATVTSVSRLDRFRTYVHLDIDGERQHAWCNGGPQLPAALRDVLLCDGVVQPLWMSEGRPINVGRALRIVPAHTRRQVLDRDRTCRHPACHATRHLEVHHLRHWTRDLGPTDTDNLLALCPHHHDAHHRGAFTITGNADEPGGLTFHGPRGRPIAPAARPTAPTDPPPQPARPYHHPLGETMQPKWIWFPDPSDGHGPSDEHNRPDEPDPPGARAQSGGRDAPDAHDSRDPQASGCEPVRIENRPPPAHPPAESTAIPPAEPKPPAHRLPALAGAPSD